MSEKGGLCLNTSGIFISESKNRFLCSVLVDGVETICYIPSSCRLDNFLDLQGRKVYLTPNISPKASTEYAVTAIPYKRSVILLNSSFANKAVNNCIHNRQFAFLGKRSMVKKEYSVDGYKADFYIPCSKTIIEVKSVISLDTSALFPTVFSQRSLDQLQQIKDLLSSGYYAYYFIVSLNPYVKEIILNKNSALYSAIQECVDLGMEIYGYSCGIKNNEVCIKTRISIIS